MCTDVQVLGDRVIHVCVYLLFIHTCTCRILTMRVRERCQMMSLLLGTCPMTVIVMIVILRALHLLLQNSHQVCYMFTCTLYVESSSILSTQNLEGTLVHVHVHVPAEAHTYMYMYMHKTDSETCFCMHICTCIFNLSILQAEVYCEYEHTLYFMMYWVYMYIYYMIVLLCPQRST